MRTTPGELEAAILAASAHAGPAWDGVRTREEAEGILGRAVSIGSFYTTVGRMTAKGLLETWDADPSPDRGNRPRRFIRITAAGREALQRARESSARLLRATGLAIPRLRPIRVLG